MQSAVFLSAWQSTGREEGGYVNDPRDSGGETNWGITATVARAHGYLGDMRDLSQERARQIAKEQYWDIMRLDDIAQLSFSIARELFDSGFNVGQSIVGQWLQRCLNVALPGSPLRVDGLIGRVTISALNQFLKKRGADGELVLLRALNSFQSVHYTELAERREKDEAFWFGWQLRRVEVK